MIYVDLKGNLGNQMFNYACAREIQKKTNQTICLCTYNLIKLHNNYKFSLDIFRLNKNVIISSKKEFKFYSSDESIFYKIFKKLTLNLIFFQKMYFYLLSFFGVYVWSCDTYVPIKYIKNKKNIYLSGYWQSELYFEDIREILLYEFSIKEYEHDYDASFYDKIINKNSICVSMRCGDYLNNEVVRKKHFVCDLNYFQNAIDLITHMCKNPVFIYFSDDVEYIRKNIQLQNESYFEPNNLTLKDKVFLMSKCKHFVLSNSSFSWWIQYLSTNESKIVVAPNIWYSDGHKADIYSNKWSIINVK